MTPQEILDAAIKHHDAGRLREAEALYHQVLSQNPNQPAVLQRMAHLAYQVKDHPTAEYVLRHAIRLAPESADNQFNLGLVLFAQGRCEEAITAYQAALVLRPNDPVTLSSLGQVSYTVGRYQEGIDACRRAIEFRADYPEAYNNLGINLVAVGEHLQAIDAYHKALELRPTFAVAQNNLGAVMVLLDRSDEAITAYQKAIDLDPNYADAQNNLGKILQDVARHDEAIAAYRKAIALDPGRSTFHSNYLFSLNYHPASDARLILEESRRWAQDVAGPLKAFITPHANDHSPDRPLRIAYVSPDLRLHSVAFFLLPLLEAHDRAAIHITCYPVTMYADPIVERFRAACDQWRPVTGLSGEEAAAQIRSDRIDILVDLAGHTAQNRTLLFARRPAPVQVSWLGYPATTGLEAIDYRLTDGVADPVSDDPALFSEKLIRLPRTAWCFTPLSGSPDIVPPPHLAQGGKGHITFGSLNFFGKINDDTLHLWARLMQQVPHSRLLLKIPARGETTAHLHRIFGEHGIGPERLELLLKEPDITRHLERYHRIDIALDTFPYNGTTTTCEALWMGVPVVTRAGDRHASRVGKSLLTTLGLEDLVAHGPEQFVEIAKKLAGDSGRQQTLRGTLRTRMKNSPLMDAPAFARNVESAYRQMWRTWCDSKK